MFKVTITPDTILQVQFASILQTKTPTMLVKSLAAALFASVALADTATFTLYSGAGCTGDVIEVATLGNVNESHKATLFSLKVTNVGQSFFGQNPPIHGFIVNTVDEPLPHTRGLAFSLTNTGNQCHTLTDGGLFGLVQSADVPLGSLTVLWGLRIYARRATNRKERDTFRLHTELAEGFEREKIMKKTSESIHLTVRLGNNKAVHSYTL